jgi:hypothetical protein
MPAKASPQGILRLLPESVSADAQRFEFRARKVYNAYEIS